MTIKKRKAEAAVTQAKVRAKLRKATLALVNAVTNNTAQDGSGAQVKDAAGALKSLAEVVKQLDSAAKEAAAATVMRRSGGKSAEAAGESGGVIEIPQVLTEAADDGEGE